MKTMKTAAARRRDESGVLLERRRGRPREDIGQHAYLRTKRRNGHRLHVAEVVVSPEAPSWKGHDIRLGWSRHLSQGSVLATCAVRGSHLPPLRSFPGL